ncbi:hypothetical protein JOB18_044890 [Solea senegalensis]|uniref:Uncharacterized protein n=1 Tax=Solea senegalensis TaxID=28829 RepID=A0AAV6S624_SOLSE|nr:hypothetical protein JOB18_044890 [Solea senegalensis]
MLASALYPLLMPLVTDLHLPGFVKRPKWDGQGGENSGPVPFSTFNERCCDHARVKVQVEQFKRFHTRPLLRTLDVAGNEVIFSESRRIICYFIRLRDYTGTSG